MKQKIVVVGLGGIGRYHLFGLVTKGSYDIQAVDRSETAIAQARALVGTSDGGGALEFMQDIGGCWLNPDLTIVATQANGRVALVESLLAHGHRTLLLEKIVAQSTAEYARLLTAVAGAGARVWVNTPMRYNPLYQELAEVLQGQVISFSAAGADLGLATNAIHFVDLFGFLLGHWNLRFDSSMISRDLLPNKRGADLVEFGGTLVGADDKGSTITVTNLPLVEATQTITITSEPLSCFVDVTGETAHVARRSDHWRARTMPYRESRVSEVTPLAVADIVSGRACRFPSVADLFEPHRELFRVFGAQLRAINGTAPDALPIT